MRKLFLFVIPLYAVATYAGNAQRIISISVLKNGTNDASSVKHRSLGDAYLECTYDLRYLTDTVNADPQVTEDVMKLQVGHGISKFYSHRTYIVDSLIRAGSATEIRINPDKYVAGERYIIYKDNTAGRLTYTHSMVGEYFRYEEELVPQEWTITEDSREILGYECQRAECDFRGRKYTAWFSPEIPLNDGPWKFNGLPGLIMAAGDDAGHYSFIATGIKPLHNEPVEYAEYQYHKTNRREFLKLLRKSLVNIAEFMNTHSSSIKIEIDWSASPDGMVSDKELLYDFMERDYR